GIERPGKRPDYRWESSEAALASLPLRRGFETPRLSRLASGLESQLGVQDSRAVKTNPGLGKETGMVAFTVNGERKNVDVSPSTPLLWVLREHLGITGTKFGCGIASCGACTVHLDGEAVRSCATPMSMAEGRAVTTIEGLSRDGTHPLQKAWIV